MLSELKLHVCEIIKLENVWNVWVEYMYILEYFESLLIYLNVYSYFQIPTSLQHDYFIIMKFNQIDLDILSYNLKYIIE